MWMSASEYINILKALLLMHAVVTELLHTPLTWLKGYNKKTYVTGSAYTSKVRSVAELNCK